MGDWRETTETKRTFAIGMQPRSNQDSHSEISVESHSEGFLTLRQDGDCIMVGSRQLADLLAIVAGLTIEAEHHAECMIHDTLESKTWFCHKACPVKLPSADEAGVPK